MAKKETRAARRQRQLEAAASVEVPTLCDVAVVGAGAAGLAAAITAAEAGATVVALERDLACGTPILATGNGRCNFANIRLDPRRFNDPAFVDAVCGRRWLDDVLAFFRECGMRWCLEDDRLYPTSRQAASVRNVLLARARREDVVLAPCRKVTAIQWLPGACRLTYADPLDGSPQLLDAHAVVIATGGVASRGPVEGLDDLQRTPTTPVLCPLACEDSPLLALDGRRVHVLARLTKADSFFPSWQERGEALFRSYGLSGIVTFDASRRAEAGDLIELDLAPDLNKSELQQLVDQFAHGDFELGCLDGVIDPVVAATLERLARELWHVDWPEHEAPKTPSAALIALVKALPFVVTGPAEPEHAQVMRGGLATSQFVATTLQCSAFPLLYACGEALDVDADCGGFNLAWAWKSGMVAGAAAAERARR